MCENLRSLIVQKRCARSAALTLTAPPIDGPPSRLRAPTMLAQALLVASLLYEVEPTRVPVSETRGASCMELHHPLSHNDISLTSTASECMCGNASVALVACTAARVEARELLRLDLLVRSAAAPTGAQGKSAESSLPYAQPTGRKAWTSACTSGLAPGHALRAAHGEPVRGAVRNVTSPASALSTLGGEATVCAAGAFAAIASRTSTCTDSVSPAAGAPGLMADRTTRDHNTLLRADWSATHHTPKPKCHGEIMAGTQQPRHPPARAATCEATRGAALAAALAAARGEVRAPLFFHLAMRARSTAHDPANARTPPGADAPPSGAHGSSANAATGPPAAGAHNGRSRGARP